MKAVCLQSNLWLVFTELPPKSSLPRNHIGNCFRIQMVRLGGSWTDCDCGDRIGKTQKFQTGEICIQKRLTVSFLLFYLFLSFSLCWFLIVFVGNVCAILLLLLASRNTLCAVSEQVIYSNYIDIYAEQLFVGLQTGWRCLKLADEKHTKKNVFVHQMFATHEFGFYFWQGYTWPKK